MKKDTALAVFERLDRMRTPNENALDEGDVASAPTYAVRLDAAVDVATEQRRYRVRVTEGPWGTDRDAWLYVLEVATEFEVEADIQNAGIELT